MAFILRGVGFFFLQIEERMSSAQELSEGWREIKEQKQDLSSLFHDMEQQLLSFSRRPAELETKIAQNMLTQAKVELVKMIRMYVFLVLAIQHGFRSYSTSDLFLARTCVQPYHPI